MTVRAAHPRMTRTWTVELHPEPQGPVLVCAQCPTRPHLAHGSSARSAALAHLARHARHSLLPSYLRTCQCHERGCRWHPRHRGCDGPLLLVLTCERAGRLWRLTDTCAACAGAMHHASVVPETALSDLPVIDRTRPRRRRAGAPGRERALVRDMLSLLAASLPFHTSPEARLLALQCVLRCDADGSVRLPHGLIRGMILGDAGPLWQELLDASWIRSVTPTPPGMQARLNDPLLGLPGRGPRSQAAHWTLVQSSRSPLRHTGSTARLATVALQAHTQPSLRKGAADSHMLARMCGMNLHRLLVTAQGLLDSGVLQSCSLTGGEDLAWSWPEASASPQGAHAGRGESSLDPGNSHLPAAESAAAVRPGDWA